MSKILILLVLCYGPTDIFKSWLVENEYYDKDDLQLAFTQGFDLADDTYNPLETLGKRVEEMDKWPSSKDVARYPFDIDIYVEYKNFNYTYIERLQKEQHGYEEGSDKYIAIETKITETRKVIDNLDLLQAIQSKWIGIYFKRYKLEQYKNNIGEENYYKGLIIWFPSWQFQEIP